MFEVKFIKKVRNFGGFTIMFPSDTDFETEVTLENESLPNNDEIPFRILFLGDWSGRENRFLDFDPMDLHPLEIDRDNFDDVMKKMRVGLNLDFQGNSENFLPLEFSNIDEFHPDQIFQRLPLFENLRDIRKKLTNQDTFNEAAREVYSWLTDNQPENINETEILATIPSNQSVSGNLLDQILDNNKEDNSDFDSQISDKSQLSAFISKLVKPHLIQTDAVEQSKLLLIVDEVISDLMRKILHHPQFQSLEAAWRSLYFLVRQIETTADLKIYLLDISKDELTIALKSVNDLTDSPLFSIIKNGNLGLSNNEPWAIVGGNFSFSLNVDDVASLIRIAKISDNADTPFISHIRPEIFGFKSFDSVKDFRDWKVSDGSIENKLLTTLRALPEAIYLGLILPRFLVRLPYGERTEPIEGFYFEEFSSSSQHENYLWGNPIFICILLLAQTYSEYGWDIKNNLFVEIDELPIHLYDENNEVKTKSTAEIFLTENNFEQVLSLGFIPLVSYRGSDRIKLGRLQSIADPFASLKGKW